MGQKLRTYIPDICVVLLVMGMVGLSELLHEKEIIFPEITALAVGAVLAPKLSWRTSNIRMFLLIAICSVFGLCMVIFVPLPLEAKIMLGYVFCQLVFLYSGTSFAPMISAAILPILMGTESIIYPISSCGFTFLIILTRKLMIRMDLREQVEFHPLDHPKGVDWKVAVIRQVTVCIMALICIPLGVRFCMAPPLLVAFTEFTRKGNKARTQPVKVSLVLTACAAGGAYARLILCQGLGLPLTMAAVAATVLLIVILRNAHMFLPPAGAMAILPMIVPDKVLLLFPLQVLTGTVIYLLVAGIAAVYYTDKQ